MAISPAQRGTLEDALHDSLGEEAAQIMMEHLPHGGSAALATKVDLLATRTQLERKIDTTRGELEHKIDGVMAAIVHLREVVEARLERQDERAEARLERQDERIEGKASALRADFRSELLAAVQAQTRTLLLGMVGTVTSLTAVAYALSRIFPAP